MDKVDKISAGILLVILLAGALAWWQWYVIPREEMLLEISHCMGSMMEEDQYLNSREAYDYCLANRGRISNN